ncbi:hypothetical protein CYXG_00150 [Synechococcus phage S-SSM4]|uniref:Uncharacterized protein n=1 Tax=Synechococcus phage S-SSM4 TaxID=536466 RepID=M1TUV3_9CAUD|nr:hypothetical protein CYXG_00150 [Synechococcus phage S-SSM4]AGG54214.1 hypothetical protein CYXG_00150 [Synechococcus phage S-SSM4]AGG54428.1 hypothetical protein CYWG_00144 [Cyanophage S-SSM6b]|tara:strand:+ start:890 stop:1459 length:570 start_codon:yes stop_codon:yes gene_type:complete
MPLWGVTDADESKPKWAVQGGAVDPSQVFATEQGWVLRHYKKGDQTEFWDEVIVAVDGLVGAGSRGTNTLGAADITAVFFEQEALDQGDTGTVVVIYNEKVTVTAGATLAVTGSTTGAVTATYARGTTTNRVEFDFTVPSQAETLSIGAQTISGTIVDTTGGATSDKAFVAGDVIGAGGSGTDKTLTIS